MENVEIFDTFDNTGDTKIDNSVILQEVDISTSINNTISDAIEYPCVIIGGIETQEEVKFFLNRECDQKKALPFYLMFDGFAKKIGLFELTLNNLLAVRCLANYSIKMYKNSEDFRCIDLQDSEQLLKFITL